MIKFALVSHTLPPAPSGQAMMLYRLLKNLDPNSYCLITSDYYDDDNPRQDFTHELPGEVIHLPREFRLTRGYRYGLSKWREGINFTLGILLRGRLIARAIRQENCRAIVACTGGCDLLDLPAAYFASRLAGVAFYPYYFDDYYYQWWTESSWTALDFRPFVRRLEPLLVRGAKGVIVPNAFMGHELELRYGVKPTVIPNSCDTSVYEATPLRESIQKKGVIRIVYTGAVYIAHYDSFVNLIKAIRLLNRQGVELHIYTSQHPDDLIAKGIRGPVVYHDHVALSDISAVQVEADILFLPLSFNSPYPQLIRTSAPGKMGEYLATGRPILAHAPSGSFVTWYFRKHKCGIVVDHSDPEILARAIEQILEDVELQRAIGESARECAKSDFSLAAAQSKFIGLLSPERQGAQ